MKKTTARELLTKNIPLVSKDRSVKDTLEHFLSKAKSYNSVDYLYCLDEDGHLEGIVSIKELLQADKKTFLSTLMSKKLIVASPQTHQERLVYLSINKKVKAIPIVQKNGKFLWVIASETILKILHEESQSDIMHLGGFHHHKAAFDNIFDQPLLQLLLHRVPRLLVGMLGGILAAKIIGNFELILQKNLMIASFIPLLVYIADATWTQIEAFTIRDLALDPKLNFWRYLWRQWLIVLCIAIACSVGGRLLSQLFFWNYNFSLIIGISLGLSIFSSLFTGFCIPYILHKFHQDPANASGPFATILQDLLSVIIYFTIASLLLP